MWNVAQVLQGPTGFRWAGPHQGHCGQRSRANKGISKTMTTAAGSGGGCAHFKVGNPEATGSRRLVRWARVGMSFSPRARYVLCGVSLLTSGPCKEPPACWPAGPGRGGFLRGWGGPGPSWAVLEGWPGQGSRPSGTQAFPPPQPPRAVSERGLGAACDLAGG